MYGQVRVNKFSGLNSTVAPELIQDGEARDIMNFRMEKVGKLVSRDGCRVGLEIDRWNDTITEVTSLDYKEAATAYMINGGIVGMGEMVLEEKWTELDAQRFMVYFIRAEDIADVDYYRNRMAVLISPIEGTYKNKLMIHHMGATSIGTEYHESFDQKPQGKYEDVYELTAPNKMLYPDAAADDDDMWIKHYIDMNQYRNRLVISDQTNGDMILEDEYSRGAPDQGVKNSHGFHLRPNTLQEFDIDTIRLESRIYTDMENDATNGIKNGMALYKYRLQKKTYKTSNDNFSDTFGNIEWLGELSDDALSKINSYINDGRLSTLLMYADKFNGGPGLSWETYNNINTETKFRFTNADDTIEFNSLLDPVELAVDEFKDSNGVIQKETSTNIYVWDDLQIKYFPCSGIDSSSGVYLRDADRIFNKLSEGTARIKSLNPKTNRGKYAPLGVWRYKFVWDFGDGIYSNPSQEILVPDMMWSAIPDGGMTKNGVYARPENYAYDEYLDKSLLNYNSAGGTEYNLVPYDFIDVIDVPRIFNDSGDLTYFGQRLYDVKEKLFAGANHRFGIKEWTSYADVNALAKTTVEDLELLYKGDFTCNTTVFYAKEAVNLRGIIAEGAFLSYVTVPLGVTHTLIVPIFQSPNNSCTYNSLFDNFGRLRYPYRNDIGVTSGAIQKEIVLPGYNPFIGPWATALGQPFINTDPGTNTELKYYQHEITGNGNVPNGDDSLYFNLICIDEDQNNDNDYKSGPNYLRDIRPVSMIRAVKEDSDRLTRTSTDVPNEVKDRLILQGTAEIVLSEIGDRIQWSSQYIQNVGATHADNEELKDYDIIREVSKVGKSWDDTVVTEVLGEEGSTNIEIVVYGEGERLVATEQLTAYFPSSLLFGAPRIAIRIDNADIPARAKRLLIYRTVCSHANDWDPLSYYFVDDVPITRVDDSGSNDYGKVITKKESIPAEVDDYIGLYYFDKIKDTDLDSSNTPEQYEGLTTALKSRFNLVLNERVYYYNFIETYQPLKPRKTEYNTPIAELGAGFIRDTDLYVEDSTNDDGFDELVYVRYKYIYIDQAGIRSRQVETDWIEVDGSSAKKVVVFRYMPSNYNGSIQHVEIYRAEGGSDPNQLPVDPDYYLCGEIEPEDEGIFVDDRTETKGILGSLQPDVQTYESGLRWSELYRPDWIKPDSFVEVKSGDGKQGTGLESLYGNLICFKETSIHRLTVQSKDPALPISRTDEITPEIGVIAPNALLNIDNNLFFLSWKGLMHYDNNVVKKIDGNFTEELQFIIANYQHSDNIIRDASMGYNPYHNEIYLNVPVLPTVSVDDRQYDFGHRKFYKYERELLGHIYVLNFDKQYNTKFAYKATLSDPYQTTDGQYIYIREVNHPMQLMRMYFTNSLGELRSADISPSYYGSLRGTIKNADGYKWSGIWIETPYEYVAGTGMFFDRDEGFDGRWLSNTFLHTSPHSDYTTYVNQSWNLASYSFPRAIEMPIRSVYKSKFYTGDTETIIKRIRRVLLNIFSKGYIGINAIAIPYENDDERIDNLALPIINQSFVFNPTRAEADPISLATPSSTQRNIISVIPQNPYGTYQNHGESDTIDTWDDFYGKPIRFSVEVYAELRTQLNELVIHWRPIHTYTG